MENKKRRVLLLCVEAKKFVRSMVSSVIVLIQRVLRLKRNEMGKPHISAQIQAEL